MNGKFFDLKKEKQDRMINAALKVFALHGYRRASTDDIVKEAGISKGLLFHYFESKIGVYNFIYDYSVRYMSLELKSSVSSSEKNLFEIINAQRRTHGLGRVYLKNRNDFFRTADGYQSHTAPQRSLGAQRRCARHAE